MLFNMGFLILFKVPQQIDGGEQSEKDDQTEHKIKLMLFFTRQTEHTPHKCNHAHGGRYSHAKQNMMKQTFVFHNQT